MNTLIKYKAYLLGATMLAGLGLPAYDTKAYATTTTIESGADDNLISSTFSIKVDYPDQFNTSEDKELAEIAALEGIAAGYADGTFKPNQNITRAELASMLIHAGYIPDTNNKELLKELKGYWASAYLATAIDEGYLFLQDNQIKPEQEAAIGDISLATIKLLGTTDESIYTVTKENITVNLKVIDQQEVARFMLEDWGYKVATEEDINNGITRIDALRILTQARNEMYPPIKNDIKVLTK